jgi:hypothetical protein
MGLTHVTPTSGGREEWFQLAVVAVGRRPLDPVLWTLEILGTIAFIGGFVLLVWNLWVVWTGRRRWPARVWSIAMPLSALVVLWVAVSFKLISFGVSY